MSNPFESGRRKDRVDRFRQRARARVEARRDTFQAGREIDIADEPDDTRQQQALNRRIEVELQITRNSRVEPVDLRLEIVEREGVPHGHESTRNRSCIRTRVTRDAHQHRRATAVDDRVGELGHDDLAAQSMGMHRAGEPLV